MNERTDVLVVGGGVGGCAAALAAARNGCRVVMTEPTDWIGGQLTSQAVPPDEHAWIEQCGCTASYRAFRNAVRDHYRVHYPLTDAARNDPHLNPGGAWVSRIACEPKAALAVLEAMLRPYEAIGRLRIVRGAAPTGADVDGDRIRAVAFSDRTIEASVVIDATELGDLLPLADVEHVTGAEAKTDTGEPHAADVADPTNAQAFTMVFALSHHPGEDHTIDKPASYDFWRDYAPQLTPPWTGRMLSFTYTHPITLEPRTLPFDGCGWWAYRRALARDNLTSDAADISLINWPMNDYLLGELCTADDPDKHVEAARQQSLSLAYWLQTEAGYPGLRLRPDVTGTADGVAKYPYVREARRIRPVFRIVEQHVSPDVRDFAEDFGDSVGIGYYRIDLHPSTGGDNYIDCASLPFQIPLGSLIPQRMTNLLAACKNIGTTHITNGCYRLHPVEWNLGEAAGACAAYCVHHDTTPHAVRERHLDDYQQLLCDQGVELAWPDAIRREFIEAHRRTERG